MSTAAEMFLIFWFFIIIMLVLYGYFQKRVRLQEDMLSNHHLTGISVLVQNRMFRGYSFAQSDQNNIYNISGSVQGQNQHAYPDAYLSIDHIAITNELNKPPPKYDDAPPSYEEALKLAMAHSNSLQTYQSEQGHSADLPRTHLPAGSSID
ncbi:uncharacterized protein LOC126742867 isoform X3 [Anthonomus grandis grandis]|uniref:uncharacterized protein LOC126742867 isoform X3 n=1 Tax=Anthonomus grandis grandis TaxID=2921223 RepID=UPI0021664BBA|nr:uncharacterized protein LOC126742867 isoform X3 [Anthonomus grandis grandis]